MEKDSQWEEHLQLLLFMYRTTKHTFTGLSSYEILFGSNPPAQWLPNLQDSVVIDQSDYVEAVRGKLLQLKEIVDANSVQSAEMQQKSYKSSDNDTQFSTGQQVLLSNAVAGKLDPRWTGPWTSTVVEMKGPSTVALRMGTAERKVHINRVRPLLMKDTETPVVRQDWTPPLFSYEPVQELPPAGNTNSVPERPPSVLVHQPGGPHPVITTHSRQVIKPVQHFGRT